MTVDDNKEHEYTTDEKTLPSGRVITSIKKLLGNKSFQDFRLSSPHGLELALCQSRHAHGEFELPVAIGPVPFAGDTLDNHS